MSLHQQIKDIIEQYGEAIVVQRQFYNLLADYGAFKDTPAAKQILKDLLHSGFGTFVHELKSNGSKDILQEVGKHKKEFLSDGKYRQDVTEYIYASILYGLGVVETVENVNFDNPYSTEPQQNQSAAPASPKKPALDLEKMLADLKAEYLATFDEVVIPPKRLFSQASGYFDIATLNKQYIIETKIKLLIDRIGGDADWCENEKTKFLSQYAQSKERQQLRLGCLIALALAAIIFASVWSVNYVSSSQAREQFEQTMSRAAASEASGQYIEAIQLYKEAADNYTAGWKNTTYRNAAYEHAYTLSSRLFHEKKPAIQQALTNNDFITAKIEFESISSGLMLMGADLNEYTSIKTSINIGIDAAINQGISDLANDIYTNHGTLSPKGKQRLDDMLRIDPDNYWLNKIKGTQQ